MKLLPVISIALLYSTLATAQSKNPTTTKEMQEKINQAQQQLDKLTPEQKKMMEQMGMSTKAPSMPAGVTDAQVKSAVNGGGAFGVPSKNTALIGAIPVITLTSATVANYIKTLNDYIEKGIANDEKFLGQNVYSYFKTNKYSSSLIANEAVGFWTIGRPEVAVYIMGRTCADYSSDADMLSNFAAMLSMGGAPHRAIPLLEYLNKQYPDNTTILNNLGQAWFYLGETDKADALLEKATRLFAYHPQANYTQCLIQESKGNTPKAIQKLKNSLQYSYSLDKLNMLRKLGYKIKGSDLRVPFHPDPDPLGLRKFTRPDAPKSYEDEIRLSADWDAFQKQANEKNMELGKDLIPYQQAAAQQAQQTYNQYQKGGINALSSSTALPDNLYRNTAERNLEDMNKDGGASYRLTKARNQIEALNKDFKLKDEAQRKSLEKQYSVIADKETELAKKGENIGFNNCTVQQKYSEWVYANYNKPLEEAYLNYLHQLYLKISEELYWQQFTMSTSQFEAAKIASKKEWLGALSASRYISTNRYGKCATPQDKGSRYKLSDFDDMHCSFVSTLDFIVYKQTVQCGKMSVEFDAGKLKGNFNFSSDNTGKDRFVKGTLEATMIDKEISAGKGPLQAGASVKAGMGMEFSSRGVEDVYVTGEASVKAGSNTVSDPAGVVSDPSVNITISGRMSLISGSVSGNISGFGK
ncbi:MAG: hypothetical protein QM731_03150 [Chitinophagaceae bacterium]